MGHSLSFSSPEPPGPLSSRRLGTRTLLPSRRQLRGPSSSGDENDSLFALQHHLFYTFFPSPQRPFTSPHGFLLEFKYQTIEHRSHIVSLWSMVIRGGGVYSQEGLFVMTLTFRQPERGLSNTPTNLCMALYCIHFT